MKITLELSVVTESDVVEGIEQLEKALVFLRGMQPTEAEADDLTGTLVETMMNSANRFGKTKKAKPLAEGEVKQTESKPAPETPKEEVAAPPAPVGESEKQDIMLLVREEAKRVMKAGNREAVSAALGVYGAKNIPSVPSDKLPELLETLKGL